LVAATIPNCKAYDPAFAGEMAVIIDQGMREMMVEQQDVFYYVTLMNENYAQPNVPDGVKVDLLKGCYRFAAAPQGLAANAPQVTLMGSGAILCEVILAAQQLAEQGIAAEVFSVTSWSELARDGQQQERLAMSGHDAPAPFVQQQLSGGKGPVVAATDYVRAVPESIRAFLPPGRRYLTLGTDGFGRSDTRAELRAFFQVDAVSVVRAARHALGLTAAA
jgi:pyruvate dehydrogenase E1 component